MDSARDLHPARKGVQLEGGHDEVAEIGGGTLRQFGQFDFLDLAAAFDVPALPANGPNRIAGLPDYNACLLGSVTDRPARGARGP